MTEDVAICVGRRWQGCSREWDALDAMSELDDVIAGWGIFGEDIKPMFNEVANQGDLWWW